LTLPSAGNRAEQQNLATNYLANQSKRQLTNPLRIIIFIWPLPHFGWSTALRISAYPVSGYTSVALVFNQSSSCYAYAPKIVARSTGVRPIVAAP